MTTYIMHHGIKGMRWGIRRYQNPDGSLTELGRARLNKIYSKIEPDDEQNRKRKNVELQGVSRIDDDTDVIKKGTRLGRFSNTNKEQQRNNTYMYLTRDDEDAYENMASEGTLGFNNIPERIFKYEMSAVKDIKVVSGEKVLKDVMDKYGNKEIRDAYDLIRDTQSKGKTSFTYSANKLRGKEKWAAERMKDAELKVSHFLEKSIYKDTKISSELADKYTKLGYDAMVDAEDYFGGFEYPLIMFNPKKSTKTINVA